MTSVTVSRALAAKVLAVSPRGFERLEAAGVVIPNQPAKRGTESTYDLRVVVPAYLRHVTGAPKETPRDRRDKSIAVLNEMRIEKQRGELLPRQQVIHQGTLFIHAAKAKLQALPAAMVRAGVVPPAGQRALETHVHDALLELSRWQTELDLQRAIAEAAEPVTNDTPAALPAAPGE